MPDPETHLRRPSQPPSDRHGTAMEGGPPDLGAALARLRAAEACAAGAPDDVTAARIVFFSALVAGELCIPPADTSAPAQGAGEGGQFRPRVLTLASGPFVVAFQDEMCLADFAPAGAEFTVLAGRDLVQAMAGRGLGLGLNLATPALAYLLEAEGVDWLAEVTAPPPPPALPPEALAGLAIGAPEGASGLLAALLIQRLGLHPGVAGAALLARAVPRGGGPDLALVALVGAGTAPAPDQRLLRDLAEAARFAALMPARTPGGAGLAVGGLAVVGLAAHHPLAEVFGRVGRALPLPRQVAASAGPAAPGLDPARPPRLR
jgi:hypothetical protein